MAKLLLRFVCKFKREVVLAFVWEHVIYIANIQVFLAHENLEDVYNVP